MVDFVELFGCFSPPYPDWTRQRDQRYRGQSDPDVRSHGLPHPPHRLALPEDGHRDQQSPR